MAEQHRATAGEWASVKSCADVVVTYSCILELLHRIEALEAKDEGDTEALAARLRRPGRSQGERINSLVERIEALEAAQRAINQPSTNRIHLGLGDTSSESNHPAKPDSSLVERVANATDGGTEWQARAAIREIAAWLREQRFYHSGSWAMRLEEEAEQ